MSERRPTLVWAYFGIGPATWAGGRAICLLPSAIQPTFFFFSFWLTAATAHHRPLIGDRLIAHLQSTLPKCILHRIGFGLVLDGGSSFWRVVLQWQASAQPLEQHRGGGSESIDPIRLAGVGKKAGSNSKKEEGRWCSAPSSCSCPPLLSTLSVKRAGALFRFLVRIAAAAVPSPPWPPPPPAPPAPSWYGVDSLSFP